MEGQRTWRIEGGRGKEENRRRGITEGQGGGNGRVRKEKGRRNRKRRKEGGKEERMEEKRNERGKRK